MLAGIFVDKDAGSLASINTPSGWTAVHLLDVGSGFSALGVYSKTADSADVAASNFTFTGSGTTASMSMVGHILRISDWGATAGLTYLNDAVVPGVTPSPAVASSLYVVFAGCIDGSAIVDITGVSIANSNPSWTVRGPAELMAATKTHDLKCLQPPELKPQRRETSQSLMPVRQV